MVQKLLFVIAAVLAPVTYLLTAYLTFEQFGFFWGLLSLTPAGVIAVWFVGTWPLALLGFASYYGWMALKDLR